MTTLRQITKLLGPGFGLQLSPKTIASIHHYAQRDILKPTNSQADSRVALRLLVRSNSVSCRLLILHIHRRDMHKQRHTACHSQPNSQLVPLVGRVSRTVQVHCQHDTLANFNELPLHNKRILITAPRQYASKLTCLLVEAGARPVWVPGVAITRLTEQQHIQQLDAALHQLEEYTHLAFTSKNGILAVLERLTALEGGQEAAAAYVRQSGIKLCALGADGLVLQEAGLQVDVSPAEASTKGLAAELAATGQAQGARVLCPVPEVTGGLVEPPVVPRFMDALAAAGASAVRVAAYLTTLGLAGPECCLREAEMLQQGYFDAIAFSSTAEAQGLCTLMGGKATVTAAVQQHCITLAAHGPYTAAGAGDVLGLPVPVVSKNFSTFDGLVAALTQAVGSQQVPSQ